MSTSKLDDKYLALMRRCPLIFINSKRRFHEAVVLMKELTVPARLSSLTESESDYLDVLSDLIAKYEKKNWQPLAKPMTPVEALQYLLEQSGTTQSALARQTGVRQSHISEFLSGSRDLSKESIVKIANFFRVSPELFLPRRSYISYGDMELWQSKQPGTPRQYTGSLSFRESGEIGITSGMESINMRLPTKLVNKLKALAKKKKISQQVLIGEILMKCCK